MTIEESFKIQRVAPVRYYMYKDEICSVWYPVENFYKQWEFVEMKGDIPVLRKRG